MALSRVNKGIAIATLGSLGVVMTGCGGAVPAAASRVHYRSAGHAHHKVFAFHDTRMSNTVLVFSCSDLSVLYAVRQYRAVGPVLVPSYIEREVNRWAPQVQTAMLDFVSGKQLRLDATLVKQILDRPSDQQVLSSLPGWVLQQRDLPSGNSTYWTPKSGQWPGWDPPSVVRYVTSAETRLPGPLTTTNVSLGGLHIGLSESQVRSLLGKPQDVGWSHGTPFPAWEYPNKGLTVSFYSNGSSRNRGGVESVSIDNSSRLRLNSGIGIGSPISQIIRVYPRVQYVRFKQYANVFVQGQQNVLLGGGMVYHPQLQMVLDNGVVTNIRLSNEELPTPAK